MLAENPWPARLSLELSDSLSRTCTTVPAGMVIISATGLVASVPFFAFALESALPAAEPSVDVAGESDFAHPMASDKASRAVR